MEEKSILNRFLVNVFNEILKTEEQCIAKGEFNNLSIRELHVIEAVCAAEKEETNSSATIAKALNVTAGTLTTAVGPLVKKGYLIRVKDEMDKRIVRLFSTELGKKADALHHRFHEEMVDDVLSSLSPEETVVFIQGLSNVSGFFRRKYNTTRDELEE